MSRVAKLLETTKVDRAVEVDAEVERLNGRPDEIPHDVWELMEDNGRVATQRLNDILNSPKFMRLRAGDQAKLIALAQNRIYGMPKSNSGAANKRTAGMLDVTQHALNDLVARAALPEYKRSTVVIDDEGEI